MAETKRSRAQKKAQQQADAMMGPVDLTSLALKADHAKRPIWVAPDPTTGLIHIFLETFSPVFAQAYDFLIAIAEPLNRPMRMHEYQLTPASLYAAASIGLQTEDIIQFIDRLCKTDVPEAVKSFIKECTSSYGKVSIAVKKNRYFVESANVNALQKILEDEDIRKARVVDDQLKREQGTIQSVNIAGVKQSVAGNTEVDDSAMIAAAEAIENVPEDLRSYIGLLDDDDSDDEGFDVVSFEIRPDHLETVQRRCMHPDINYPLISEYDFRHDNEIRDVKMDLKPTTTLRPYQEKSLRKMFGRGRARSGIIVLPCGAGKTLTGVSAACTIRKRTLVLCTSAVAVDQWRSEFLRWAQVEPDVVTRFTSTHKDKPANNGVIICTYSILSYGGKRSYESQQLVDFISRNKWGLMIFDEVQVAPAEKFRQIMSMCPCHCKLGLTATLVREDDKIKDLFFLLGPKLYEANWMELQEDGYIAKVKCAEVWVPMTKAFFREYLSDQQSLGIDATQRAHLRRHLWVMNPNKFQAMEYLIRDHEVRGDKVIVFSDDVFALQTFAKKLNKPYIFGPTPDSERLAIINQFKSDPTYNTIFCSRIADNSIDLPGANVLIQISSMGKSRRQEAQRLGRILRAKANTVIGEVNAFFYSVISQDTLEMSYNQGRQRFLMDQGYSYSVRKMKDLPGFAEQTAKKPFGYSTQAEQDNLLMTVLARKISEDVEVEAKEEKTSTDDVDLSANPFERREGAMATYSGASGMVYQEERQRPVKKGRNR